MDAGRAACSERDRDLRDRRRVGRLDDVEPLIGAALEQAAAQGVSGQAVTPFVLSWLHRESDGRTLRANRDLVVGNARLAGELAACR